jgi:hypothetical protein
MHQSLPFIHIEQLAYTRVRYRASNLNLLNKQLQQFRTSDLALVDCLADIDHPIHYMPGPKHTAEATLPNTVKQGEVVLDVEIDTKRGKMFDPNLKFVLCTSKEAFPLA